MFAVVRHPDIETVGIVPQAAFEMHQAKGFYRVSEWRESPSDFYLPDYADGVDLDAPAEEEEPKKRRPKKADDEQPEPDNEPETTDEENSE